MKQACKYPCHLSPRATGESKTGDRGKISKVRVDKIVFYPDDK